MRRNAAGSTDADAKLIRVSTWERARRGPLVKHEARNYYWTATGNGRLTFSATVADSL